MEAERRGADAADSVKQRREARAADIDLADRRSLSQLLMPAIVPASAVGALPPSSTGEVHSNSQQLFAPVTLYDMISISLYPPITLFVAWIL